MSLDNLPVVWVSTTLEVISSKITDGSHNPPKPSSEGKPMISAKNIVNGNILFDEGYRLISEDSFEVEARRTRIQPNDILLTIVGALGRSAIVPNNIQEFTLQRSVAVLNSSYCDTKFLKYSLDAPATQYYIVNNAKGTAQKGIYLNQLKQLPIAIAPLAEQQEIVRQLDVMLAQVEQIKARLDAIPLILKKFRQSVLADAVSGKLTEEWRQVTLTKESVDSFLDIEKLRKDNYLTLNPDLKKKKSSIESQIDMDYLFEIPNSWAFTSWGKISEWITYGFTKPMPKSESGKKLLTAKDVQNFNIKIEDANFTTEEAYISLSDKDRPQQGDLLITKDGTIGRSGLVRTDIPFCINQSVAVCWLRSTGMNKDYLEYLANSEFTQKFVFDKAQGMAIQHLSIIDFAKCPVPVPPKEEQDAIVTKLDVLYKCSKNIENLVHSAQKRVNLLTQSILAKAFSGELTAEWREQHQDLITGVNSAESLLAKIQAEREASKPVKKTRAKKEA